MPRKWDDNVKSEGARSAMGDWKDALDVSRLSTTGWQDAGQQAAEGKSDAEIRQNLLDKGEAKE